MRGVKKLGKEGMPFLRVQVNEQIPSQGFILGIVTLNVLVAYLEGNDRKEGEFATFFKLLSFKKPQRITSPSHPQPPRNKPCSTNM